MLGLGKNDKATLFWNWNGRLYSVPFSKDDVLMLARAVEEEGYPPEGTAWTLLQRYAWVTMAGVKTTLGRLVQAYAQPINPLWFPTGSKHLEEIQRLASHGDTMGVKAENARAQSRLRKANQSWDEISLETQDLIHSILTSRSAQPSPVPGAVHYWASRAPDFAGNQAKKPNLVLLDRGYGFGPGRNVFFAEKGGENFNGVRISNGLKAWPGGKLPSGTGMLVALGLGYAAWKWLS